MRQLPCILTFVALVAAVAVVPGTGFAKKPVPAVIDVDCDAGGSINDALTLGLPGQPLTINIIGTCNENVTITLSQVTLQGVSPVISIIVGQPEPGFNNLDPIDQSPIAINGASAVLIDNLTIQGGVSSGITVVNSQVVITNCVIKDHANHGVFVGGGSRAQIDSCEIEDNTRDGVLALAGTAFITNSTISGNVRHGVNAYGSGFVQIGRFLGGGSGPSTITGNTRDGVRAGGSSQIDVYDSEITLNGEFGVRVFRSSGSFLEDNTIDGNVTATLGQAGVGVFDSSSASLVDNDIIDHENGHGIIATNTSTVTMTGNTVTGNGKKIEFGSGVVILRNSALRMRGGNSITDNDGGAIEVSQNSWLRATGGGGETITSTGVSEFDGSPRLALSMFQAGNIDMRGGTTITGDADVGALSTLRLRDNTLTGNIDVRENSALGIRNSVTLTGTVTCDASVVEFSNNGTPKC